MKRQFFIVISPMAAQYIIAYDIAAAQNSCVIVLFWKFD